MLHKCLTSIIRTLYDLITHRSFFDLLNRSPRFFRTVMDASNQNFFEFSLRHIIFPWSFNSVSLLLVKLFDSELCSRKSQKLRFSCYFRGWFVLLLVTIRYNFSNIFIRHSWTNFWTVTCELYMGEYLASKSGPENYSSSCSKIQNSCQSKSK